MLNSIYSMLNKITDVKTFMSVIKSFEEYENNKLIRRAIEREVEIIGEAMNRILKISPKINIPHARSIVSIRNKIIHGYDEIDNVILYTVATKHLDLLRIDIETL